MSAAATVEWCGRGVVRQIGGAFSHDSEHDLAMMVSDFLENGTGSSCGADSWCSSDSDSGHSDLHHLADKVSVFKHSVVQYESDLISLVHSHMLSIKEPDLCCIKSGPCNASCIRFSLVKLLRLSGYNAAVCESRWQGSNKVPGGDHEYIDVIINESSERLIIDIDFRSHFEIARAVDSYNNILRSLPVVFVGSLTRLIWYLQVMEEAARSSLKQNSMPLPPWRSLAYLQAKWQSPYQRYFDPDEASNSSDDSSESKQCREHLKRLLKSLHTETEDERLKSLTSDNHWRMKPEVRRRHSLFFRPF